MFGQLYVALILIKLNRITAIVKKIINDKCDDFTVKTVSIVDRSVFEGGIVVSSTVEGGKIVDTVAVGIFSVLSVETVELFRAGCN